MQPRIDPTVSNAETISSQLGVPIKNYSKTFEKEVSTIYSYVQFKHSGMSIQVQQFHII